MKNAKALYSAIVLQAVKDYTAVTRRIKKLTKELCDARDQREIEALKTKLDECEKILKFDLVPFFESDWCNDISPIDGKKMLTQLKAQKKAIE